MEEIKPRYEFRIWADTLAPIHRKLIRMAQPKTTESGETYLVSRATDKTNAKIRAALMDIKVFVAEHRGLQQWKPILKAGFPLDSSLIKDQVLPSLELPAPTLEKSGYELNEFLEMMRRVDGLAVAEVRKVRHQFRIGECAAEFAEITINGVPSDTVAVESVDAEAVLKLVRELGITDPNTSYVQEIKNVLGWASRVQTSH